MQSDALQHIDQINALFSVAGLICLLAQCFVRVLPTQNRDNLNAVVFDGVINRMCGEHAAPIALFDMVDGVIEHRVFCHLVKPHLHASLIDNSLLQAKGVDAIVKDVFKIFVGGLA